MKRKLTVAVPFIMLFVFGLAGMSNATLTTIGTAEYEGIAYKLIWDDDNNGNSLVWLDYTYPDAIWQLPMYDWVTGLAGALEINLDPGFSITWDDDSWRLPSAGTSPTPGYITTSEMGHLYYEELNNQEGSGLQNTGDFINLQSYWYWTGTEYTYNSAWYFDTYNGITNITDKDDYLTGLAVRSGEVSFVNPTPTPEPATMLLFGTGMAGFVAARKKRKGNR